MEIKLKNIFKKYKDLDVIENLSINFSSDKIHCIFGPSGCGKTTLLNIISNIIKADSGKVYGIEDKTISYVFQEDRLIPYLTVEENIMFVLKSRFNEKEAKQLTQKYIAVVKLCEFKNCLPSQLSGGMRQRVSIARAFAYSGDILVMDEPFKGLDLELKKSLMNYVIEYTRKENKLLIYVTHDTYEAIYIADNIYVFEGIPLKIKKQINIDIPYCKRDIKKDELIINFNI